MSDEMSWNPEVKQKFDTASSKMPAFQRPFAEKMISSKVQVLAKERNVSEIGEEDLVKAFFADCPDMFKDLMKRVLDESSIDYKKYDFE